MTNTGKRNGKEVVQAYLKDKVASVAPDVKRLIYFEKIDLKPGETKTISFNIISDHLKMLNSEHEFVIEEGYFDLFIGGNSQTENKATFKYIY